jgi:hypothetical protein
MQPTKTGLTSIKRWAACLGIVAAVLTLQIPTNGRAQGVELGDGLVITAEVVGIDRVDRAVALLGPDGNVVALKVGHEARNFDQVQIGDQVKVEYYESVALYLGKRGQKPDAAAGLVAARSAKGDKPAGVVVRTVDVSATVKAIDTTKRTVTLELPDGRRVTSKVDKAVEAFDTLQVGDSIHARYTEALAISVDRP